MSVFDSRNFGIYDNPQEMYQPSFGNKEAVVQSIETPHFTPTIPSYQFGIYSSLEELIQLLDKSQTQKNTHERKSSCSGNDIMKNYFI